MRLQREPSLVLCALALAPLVLDLCFATRALPPPPDLPAGRYAAQDVPLTSSEQELLRGVPATKRRYLIGGHPVQLLSLDAGVNRHVLHEPSYCLGGNGWVVTRDEVRAVRAGSVRQLTAVQPGSRQVRRSVYFFRSGGRWYTSRWRHLLDYARARWWPRAAAPLNHVTLLATCTDEAGDAWIRDIALPALFGADSHPVEDSKNIDSSARVGHRLAVE